MDRILKITATVLLTVLPAAAMGRQDSRQRDSGGGSSFGQGDGSNGRRPNRFDSGSQQDSSGYNRRDSGSRNNDAGNGPSSFGASDSSPKDFGSKAGSPTDHQPIVAPKSSGAFVSKPLPAELAVLTSRSIFSRDHRAVAPASDRPASPVFRSDVAKLIFRGAMLETDHYVAFIEDSAGSRPPQWVSIGQLLTANGAQINDITLDHIVVEKSGSVRQIGVGDNLDSGTRLPSPPVTASISPSAAAAVNSAGGSTGNSSAGVSRPTGANPSATPAVTASTTGTASDEDVADMMRRRRVQELGQ